MEPVSFRRWLPRGEEPDVEFTREIEARLGVSPLVARLLWNREPTPDGAQRFLEARLSDLPDPYLLPDMGIAVTRLVKALENREPIAVHGDYDVDGITGTTLLVEGLKALGAPDVDHHIPLRLRDGYGLSADALRQAAAQGTRVVVSVDCGISAHEEAVLAKEVGLDLIITDHHQPPDKLPEALAIINPQRRDATFPFPDLSGVGVAFFLLIGLRKALREHGWFEARNGPEPDLRHSLDLVALGTIADLVPLRGVNRTLTRTGLAMLEQGRRPGVRALKQVAGVKQVTAGVVGFQLAPRLNAAGRMEDAALGVQLLLEDDMVRAMTIARRLDQCNRDRLELEKQTLTAAEAAVLKLSEQHTHAIVLAEQGWHPGVIGIVASRLVDRYHRPTVMIALDGESGKGSARSIRGFHLFEGLQACSAHLQAFGGHEMAAGLSLTTEKVRDFADALEEHVRTNLSDDDLVPRLSHDGELLLEELNLEVCRQLMQLAPYGMGNPEPVLLVQGVNAKQMQVLQEKHLRFTTCQGGYSHPAIAFGMAERREEFAGVIDLLVSPQVNSYRGRSSVQLRVRDVRPSEDK